MLMAIERCADTIAHIAQYDRENLQRAFQIEYLGGYVCSWAGSGRSVWLSV
jgi:hypothetical protein